jgi:hypothetical protein
VAVQLVADGRPEIETACEGDESPIGTSPRATAAKRCLEQIEDCQQKLGRLHLGARWWVRDGYRRAGDPS